MAEDIKDMTIMGEVHEYSKQLKADLYILRSGVALDDHEELLSVGGYSRSFSIEHKAPAIALRYLEKNQANGLDMSSLFIYRESNRKWSTADLYFESIDSIPSDMKLAVPMYMEFFKAADQNWNGASYEENTSWSFGHTLVFINGNELNVAGIPTEEIMVRRTLHDGSFNYFYPREGKLIKSK